MERERLEDLSLITEAAGRSQLEETQIKRLEHLDFWKDSILIALKEGREENISHYQAHLRHRERMEHYPDWISNVPRESAS